MDLGDPSGWATDPLDRFIAAKWATEGLNPVAAADRRTLIRRATFDLIGLPPSPEEVDQFLGDTSPEAFEKVVDRLLASPYYGERWGRHWMDVARYADTAGDNADYPIPEMHLYRDYIIDSFNADKPYDRFVQEQLAGAIDQKDTLEADLQTRNIELADAKMQLAMAQDQSDRAQSSAAAELEDLRARYEAAVGENSQMREAYDASQSKVSAIAAEATTANESAKAREIALNEAYQRAVNLQRLIEDRERALIDAQTELDSSKSMVAALSASKTELEDKLQRARGDVASEMAALTSTMIKMKDYSLTAANSRIAELSKLVNELQSKQAVG